MYKKILMIAAFYATTHYYTLYAMLEKNLKCSHKQISQNHVTRDIARTRYISRCPAGQLPYGPSATPNSNCSQIKREFPNGSTKYKTTCPSSQPPFVKKNN